LSEQMRGPSWLTEVFKESERNWAQLPDWAKPVVTPPMIKPEWVEVHFYGLVPAGQTVIDVNIEELAQTLCKAFGFTHVDNITVAKTKRET